MEGKSWDAISRQTPGRGAENCKKTWINRNRNRRKSGTEDAWSEAEDRSLVALFKEGHDWKAISEKLGRWSIGACIMHFVEYFPGLSGDGH